MASLPTFTKTWDFSGINQRISFVSLNDTMSKYLYGIKNYLVGTLGASVVYSCDGTTGPTSSSDHTDRWTAASKCTTRATVAAAAQSFCVITWAGVQVMLTYQGASDDIARISFSQGSLFTPAGTATNQPTATDEIILNAAVSLINATTSADRVFSIIGSSDNTVFRCCIFRQATLIAAWGIERVAEASNVTTGVVLAHSTSSAYSSSFSATLGGCCGTAGTANGIGSWGMRINGVSINASGNLTGGTVGFSGAPVTTLFAAVPELNAGAPLFPTMVGCVLASNTGWIGTRIDLFFPYSNGAATGDVYDDLTQNERVVIIGAAGAWPWDPTKTVVTS